MVPLLLPLAVKGTVVLALGALAAALLRRSSAALLHWVWVATFGALLAVPVLGALGPSWRVAILPDAVSTHSPAPLTSPSERPRESSIGHPTASSPSPGPARRELGIAPSPASIALWLGWLWSLGVIGVGVGWLRGFMLGRRLVRTSQVLTDEVWSTRLRAAAQASGLRTPVWLRRSECLSVPVAWGWGRPTVVLPPQSATWDAELATAVLLHEIAHLRRRDAWTQALAQAALALHWPNPLAWIAYRRFLHAREQACDDAVLQIGAPPTAYAAHLVAVARELLGARRPLASVLPMIGPDQLETRVRSILDGRRRRGQVSRWTMAATLALAVLVGGPLAAFQPVPAATVHLEEGDAVRRTARLGSVDTLDVPPVARDPQPAAETLQRPERSAPSHERSASPLDHAVQRYELVVDRNAETKARNAATEMRNAETDARNAATDTQNVQTDARNARTEMRNAETEARNASIQERTDGAPGCCTPSPSRLDASVAAQPVGADAATPQSSAPHP
ncbi:M56 family metallopeptidase [Rubrivirga sp. IMCC43871]|uniref:M56 family metallopeptidase n=1 Tax=Rubrivirga sp. IMCC43871 TaxID=3391575 RepID=UPI00398FA0E3